LDPTTEAALQQAAQKEAAKTNKVMAEYDAEMVDKNGRKINYNSVKGVTTSSKSNYYSLSKMLLALIIILL
jgi:hypothetical protein